MKESQFNLTQAEEKRGEEHDVGPRDARTEEQRDHARPKDPLLGEGSLDIL